MTRLRPWIARLRQQFWSIPAIAIALAVIFGIGVPVVNGHVTLPSALTFTTDADTARVVLQMIAGLSVSMAALSFSVIVVALVLTSQQLSPRVLQAFQRHPLNQAALGAFLATAAFSLYSLSSFGSRHKNPVPALSLDVAVVLAVLSLVLFVFFLHHMIRSLNASAVIRRITADGHSAVDAWYPSGIGREGSEIEDPEDAVAQAKAGRASFDVRAPRAGYLASVNASDILNAAEAVDAYVEQSVVIGRFVVTGAVLARVWVSDEDRERLIKRIGRAFILNEERVVDDDIAFPIRQLVDIALKGLSPSVNDPTTAENAMDSIADTLVRVARKDPPSSLRLTEDGTPRFRAVTAPLGDLVRLAFDQVRRDAASHPSFAVRLLELLAEIRDNGGAAAERCDEIDRQARMILSDAVSRTGTPDDAELVRTAYGALHTGKSDATASVG